MINKIELIQLEGRSVFAYTDENGTITTKQSCNYIDVQFAVRVDLNGKMSKWRKGSMSEYYRNEADRTRLKMMAEKYGLVLNGRLAIKAAPIDLNQPANTLVDKKQAVIIKKKQVAIKKAKSKGVSTEARRMAKSI